MGPGNGQTDMKPISHLVAYKDSAGEPTMYFGPFVSTSIAQFFKAEMPDPQPGGFCRVVPTQPFTQHEGHIVNQKIMDARRVNHDT